jgi:hypothetical protein
LIVTLATVGLAGSLLHSGAADASPAPARLLAQKKAEKAAPAKAEAAESVGGIPKIKGRIGLTPKGVHWNMNLAKLSKLYEKVFEDEFVELYKKAPTGSPQMKALDAELEDKKALIRRNKLDFGSLPTGIDNTALKGEYSYENGESMTHMTVRSGTVRNFFFFKDKLWKIYDEHKLRAGGPYGESWEEAIKILTKKFGVAPKKVDPDYAKGRNYEEAHWTDGATHIRAVNREPMLGLVWADAAVQTNLAKHRPNRTADPHKMDDSVLAATRKKEEPPPPPEEKKGKKGKK